MAHRNPWIERTNEEIERSMTHWDLDRELWAAQRKRFLHDPESKRIRALKLVGGGSGLGLGTYAELMYSNPNAGTAKNTFTTEFAINDTAGMGPQFTLPAFYFNPTNALHKTVRIISRGIQLGTASTPPTWLWTYRFNPVASPAAPPTGPIIGISTAVTGTTTTNSVWEAELDVQLTAEGAAGSNSTLRGVGMVISPKGLASPFATDLTAGSANANPPTVATFDFSLLNTLTVGMTCGTSLAANQMQLVQLLVVGLN